LIDSLQFVVAQNEFD
jgi:hypothetical protein